MKEILKGVLVILVTIALFAASQARAAHPNDLLEGELVGRGHCTTTNGMRVLCLHVKKDGRDYLVVVDNRFMPKIVYDVTGQEPPFDVRNVKPVWVEPEGVGV